MEGDVAKLFETQDLKCEVDIKPFAHFQTKDGISLMKNHRYKIYWIQVYHAAAVEISLLT